MSEAPTNPNACVEDEAPCDAHSQSCPGVRPESQALKSIHINLGWAFSAGGVTGAEYKLVLNGQEFRAPLTGSAIQIDQRLSSVAGSGRLSIAFPNGLIYSADVELGMPPIHTPEGLTQRLTNLGFYAGVRGVRNGRALWAIRAFKRKVMNGFTRNANELETDEVTPTFMEALQQAYGRPHPNDNLNVAVAFGANTTASPPCGMFGSLTYKRGSFEAAGTPDDVDPREDGTHGVWGGVAARAEVPIAGTFPIYLRAFDLTAGDPPIPNRVNLPQPIHMAQFVLFELGYWLLRDTGGWVEVEDTLTRRTYTPTGSFERLTQWAVREFQCHAKMTHAAEEDVNSNQGRYLPRLRPQGQALAADAQYPPGNGVTGALNERTRNALQAWADRSLRCPVVICASTDSASATANGSNNGSDLSRLTHENIWLHNDHGGENDRVYAIDYSRSYQIPAEYAGQVGPGGHEFPRPIVIGQFTDGDDTGPVTFPRWYQTWASQYTEVRPDTMLGKGGATGVGLTPADTLTAAELSTFKVVRTAAHFECIGYVDCLNAWDGVTMSFGPCHWTLARCSGGAADEQREMPAFLAYFRNLFAADYDTYFGRFGMTPDTAWPVNINAGTATYNCRIRFDTEAGPRLLCGATPSHDNNRYGKTWHVYYRFQMACRTCTNLRRTMWHFARVRIRDIRDKTLTVAGVQRRIGDYVTSEKGMAMLLRYHIYKPGELFAKLTGIFTNVLAQYPNPQTQQERQNRENAILLGLRNVVVTEPNDMNEHMPLIHGWTTIPQQGLAGYPFYSLNLTNAALSSTEGSFEFAPPPA
jgi:hypothetical protein